MGDWPDIATLLTDAAREFHAQPDLASTLDAIVHAAARSLRDIDHVGISIAHRNGDLETRAGTGPLVWELDAVQNEVGEGPGVHAVTSAEVSVVNQLSQETRWPAYVPRAVERGLTAQMGLRLHVGDETLGVLNLYSTRTEVIDPEVAHMADLFATHAALALGRTRQEEQLNNALQTRKVIGQAVGIVMERFSLGEAASFAYLTRMSQQTNIRLRDLAQELVQQAEDRAKRPR